MSTPTPPVTRDVNARRIVRGTVIALPNGLVDVVRGVTVVLHMANGADVIHTDAVPVKVLTDQPRMLTEAEIAPPT